MLEFGTAGIRGIVGDDKDKLNEAHAARVFDAYARYLNDKFPNETKYVIIGRDNRIRGKRFAKIAASILNKNNIGVYYDSKMMATPFVSYMAQIKKAVGAINITASHNPKEYNGIKIYNEKGYQMLPNEINELKKYFKDYKSYEPYIKQNDFDINNELIKSISNEDINSYVNEILKLNVNNINISNIKIVYSSLHGTGYQYIKPLFEKIKSNIIYEQNEIIEDENFTFVENPNPENKIAFKNTIKLAQENNADIIVVSDPDSDRVGVAYKDKNNEWKLINGNENAILICDYLINNKIKDDKFKYYLIYSFVSTSLPALMCKKNNIDSIITETGFKWIGDKIYNFKDNERFFFGFEESYGSLVNEKLALDKDAFQSIFMICLITSLAKKENKNLEDKLNDIYEKYGYMKAKSFSFDLKDQNQLENLKNKFKVINFKNATLIDYSKSIRGIEPNQMICYEFNNSYNWVSLRPSGTEPKFKIYIHVVEKTKEEATNKLNLLLDIIKNKLNI